MSLFSPRFQIPFHSAFFQSIKKSMQSKILDSLSLSSALWVSMTFYISESLVKKVIKGENERERRRRKLGSRAWMPSEDWMEEQKFRLVGREEFFSGSWFGFFLSCSSFWPGLDSKLNWSQCVGRPDRYFSLSSSSLSLSLSLSKRVL